MKEIEDIIREAFEDDIKKANIDRIKRVLAQSEERPEPVPYSSKEFQENALKRQIALNFLNNEFDYPGFRKSIRRYRELINRAIRNRILRAIKVLRKKRIDGESSVDDVLNAYSSIGYDVSDINVDKIVSTISQQVKSDVDRGIVKVIDDVVRQIFPPNATDYIKNEIEAAVNTGELRSSIDDEDVEDDTEEEYDDDHDGINENLLDTKQQIQELASSFYPYAKKRLGFDRDPEVFLRKDDKNSNNPLGKTAFYEPENMRIYLYISGRHPKDIIRSLSHELVHHKQNCDGKLVNVSIAGEGYAQKDTHLREMEREAYEQGNLIFRDFEDMSKSKENIMENKTNTKKVEKDISDTLNKRNQKLNDELMRRWKFAPKKQKGDKLNG